LGLSYASLLKRLLRQDPDVILLGEIRDAQTARLACEASLTGHFFLTSIHTKSPEDVVLRLLEMGLEPYLISTTLNMLISQRLVRKVCPLCKVETLIPDPLQKKLGIKSQWKGKGCQSCCNTGYSGRIGIFEMVVVSSLTKILIVNYSIKDSTHSFMSSLRGDSTGSMQTAGIAMIQKGITTWEEIHRCIGLFD
jgi:type II secretory ATPase GspE/PulE/Tfp pilus assembly ATPase PilB-like protein